MAFNFRQGAKRAYGNTNVTISWGTNMNKPDWCNDGKPTFQKKGHSAKFKGKFWKALPDYKPDPYDDRPRRGYKPYRTDDSEWPEWFKPEEMEEV